MIEKSRALGLRALLLAGAALCPAAAEARGTETEQELRRRVDQLERQVQSLTTTIEGLTAARTQAPAADPALAAAPPPPPPPAAPPRQPLPPAAELAICRMENVAHFDKASMDPRNLRACAAGKGKAESPAGSYDQASAHADAAATPVPQRPFPVAGVSTALEFGGDSSKASVTFAHPILYRKPFGYREPLPGREFAGFRPQLLTLSASLGVPVLKGERIFFSDEERAGRSDLDVLPGTTLKFAVDFLSFRKIGRSESFHRTAQALADAREQCRKDAALDAAASPTDSEYSASLGLVKADGKTRYVEPADRDKPGFRKTCTDADLIRYIMELDERRTAYRRAALATKYQASFWEEEKEAIPTFGLGMSVEYGSSDFKFKQATFLPPDPTAAKIALVPDQNVALATERTETEDDWRVEAHGAVFVRRKRPLDGDWGTGPYTQGVMLIGSVAYQSSSAFRPGTAEQTICGLEGVTKFARCSVLNIDRPYDRDGIILGGELRTQFNNIPVLGVLGFGPKYSIRLDDDRNQIDFPVYLSGKDGIASAGFRLRHSWGGEDLLGNPETTKTDISVFLSTPISFRKF